MFRKSLIAAAAAGFASIVVAAASLPASAAGPSGYSQTGGNNWSNDWNGGRKWHGGWNKPPVRKVCFPDYAKRKVWTKRHGWVWTTVYVGQKCVWRPVYRRHW